MSDNFDRASDLESFQRELAIAKERMKRKTPFTGFCLCCNEIIKEGRFCSIDCREDYELEQKIKRISGR
jgi:hypothetical protein